MQQPSLTADDVKNLIEDQSDTARLETVKKVCDAYTSTSLSDKQRQIAEDVFALLVNDQSQLVRENISNSLKDSNQLPHDLAVKFAGDLNDSVAFPMLKCSQVLNDQDLIEIIQSAAPMRQEAIAERQTVSENVSKELIVHGNQSAVIKLFQNDGANISDTSFETAQDRFTGVDQFQAALVARDRVPAMIRSKIIAALTDQAMDVLSSEVEVSTSIISDIVIQSHDKLVMQLSEKSTEASIEEFVDNLISSGRLTHTILIRALCQGDLIFFEVAMAKLAGVPIKNANKLIHDNGGKGFTALYQKSGLDLTYDVFLQTAFRICKELLDSGEDYDNADFRRKLIERFLTEEPELVDNLNKNDMEYLLGKIA